jgi:hypothetical protein
VGIGFWFRNSGGQTAFRSVNVMCDLLDSFDLILHSLKQSFNDMEVVLEGSDCFVRINVGREDVGIVCKCG